MIINSLFVNSKRFTFLLFSALFFIGLGYISLLPVFEGFDETAHYSRIREVEDSSASIFNKESYMDRFVVEYIGPVPYTSGFPPYSHENTYDNFFAKKNLAEEYKAKYRDNSAGVKFQPSNEINWQIQHPPLYYFLLSGVEFISKELSLLHQFFVLRVTSYFLVLVGVFLGFISFSSSEVDISQTKMANMRLGFMLYPLLFPMFFLEFARIGNDSLCIFYVGAMAFLVSRWINDKTSLLKSIAMGVILGFGLLTKALFIPISAAIGLFFLKYIYQESNKREHMVLCRNFLFFLISLILIGGSWYFYKYLIIGDVGLGIESFQLSHQGGLIRGLKEHFDFVAFIRGLIVPFVTFFWAGTWSLVRLPIVMYVPIIAWASWTLIEYISLPDKQKYSHITSLLIPAFLFMYIGLAWHVLIMIGLNGVATSPGWYLHILMPLIAPLLGLSLHPIIQSDFKARLLGCFLIYSFVFQLVAMLLNMALFAGFATKGLSKGFIFVYKINSLNKIFDVIHNLEIITFPLLGSVSFVIGFCILFYLIGKTFSKFKLS